MTRTDAAPRAITARARRLTALAVPLAVAGWITFGAVPLPAAAGHSSHSRPPVRTSTPSPLAVHPNVAAAPARSFTVTSTTDAPDDTPGDGSCSAAGACTLRAAVDEANADSGLTSITVPAGAYTLSLGELQISAPSGMEITGAGGGTAVSGGSASRVFEVSVSSGSLVALHSLAVTAGLAPVDGGGNPENGGAVLIDANSSAELDRVDVGNSSTTIDGSNSSGSGGGIADSGQLWLLSSRVHDNHANSTGGGVYVDGAAQLESDTIDHNIADAALGGFAGGGGVDNLGVTTLSGSTVSANSAPMGGGLSNRGNGSLSTTTVTGNSATGGWGGGVDNETTLSAVASRVTGNSATQDGGGIAHFGSVLDVRRSTIDGNSAAASDGGGVAAEASGVTLTDTTVSANGAGRGGGLAVHFPTTLRNVTVASNSGGAGIADRDNGGENPEIDVQDSIVAANSGGNCTAPLNVRSLGHNLDSDGTCTLSGGGDITGRSARLGPLQANGGPTPTMALLMNSPAIDAGDGQCVAVDQRGVNRPQGAGCDIGAFELAPYYWTVASDGGVFSFGGAPFLGSEGGTRLNKPIVGMAATPDGLGYWLVGSDGGVFAFGDAGYFGGRGGQPLNQPVVGMAATPDGKGYWLVARDGGIFSYGDATFFGSTGDKHLNGPIAGMAADPLGRGYWLVGSDGGVFTFGTQGFHGSMGATRLNAPVVGMAAAPDGGGYWLVATDGGIFSFASAGFFGSTGAIHLNKPMVGMAPAPDGQGYWMVASDGGIFAFGHAPFFGSTGSISLNAPMVGMAGV